MFTSPDLSLTFQAVQTPTGSSRPASRTVQQYVEGGAVDQEQVLPAIASVPTPTPALKAPLVEEPKPSSPSQFNSPEPTVATFTAPLAEWDPAQSAPPTNSRPEAPNFPQHTYEMSDDPELWKAPRPTLQPQEGVYQVPPPTSIGKAPSPIFPWETRSTKPTRVFNDDFETSPPPSVVSAPSVTTDEEADAPDSSVTTPTARTPGALPTPDPFQTYSSLNAWDDMPEIGHYISRMSRGARKGKVVVLAGEPSPSAVASEIDLRSPREGGSGSRITDFPTEVERPSLPVTPAPVQRRRFWGAERNRDGDLPPAEGVPKQEDWVSLAGKSSLSCVHEADTMV